MLPWASLANAKSSLALMKSYDLNTLFYLVFVSWVDSLVLLEAQAIASGTFFGCRN